MTKYVFGAGSVYGIDAAGAALPFGVLQDISVEFNGDIKQLFGNQQFPVAVARGKSKIEGKSSFADFDAKTFNALFFNQSLATGSIRQAVNEAASVPGSSTYTVTAANGAQFDQNLSVFLVSTGLPLKQVALAATPAVGEYKVDPATGIYTFNVAQASAALLLNYLYKVPASGETLTIDNTIMGEAPTFGLILREKFQGKEMVLRLYSATSEKLGFGLKQDDFSIPELSFQCQANSAGKIGYLSIS